MDILKTGDLVWLIAPSVESEAYGDAEPRWPFRARVIEIGRGRVRACVVNRDGEPDEDSNATFDVAPEACLATEADALYAYIRAARAHRDTLIRRAGWFEGRIDAAIEVLMGRDRS